MDDKSLILKTLMKIGGLDELTPIMHQNLFFLLYSFPFTVLTNNNKCYGKGCKYQVTGTNFCLAQLRETCFLYLCNKKFSHRCKSTLIKTLLNCIFVGTCNICKVSLNVDVFFVRQFCQLLSISKTVLTSSGTF